MEFDDWHWQIGVMGKFLRNAWYAAAWDHEIGAAPLARTILNEKVVFFRDAVLERYVPYPGKLFKMDFTGIQFKFMKAFF